MKVYLQDDSYDIEVEMSSCNYYKSKLSLCLTAVQSAITTTETIVSQTPPSVIPTPNRNHLQLPELPLPTYSHYKHENLA